jgi:hypothetical protein
MRGLLRLSMVWLLAVLFAASGVAAHLCFAAHHVAGPAGAAQQPPADHAHHAHAAIDDEDAGHHHDAAGHQHAADHADVGDHGPQDDALCGKCCGSCTLVTGIMPSVNDQPPSIVAPALIAGPADPASGSMIRVDPGIPKPIV